ncbi:ABC transporter substrate-binding protein [Auraticoccus cholistanensis]|nr:ABC transporter substrate-binding protein [Auraticoccus cholistanensis]
MGAGALAVTALGGGLIACTSGGSPTPTPPSGGAGAGAELEAPMLAERVKAGSLPPLAERLPEVPMVQELFGGPGPYGGTIRAAQTTALQEQLNTMYGTYGLLEWNMLGTDGVPSLAETFEANEDNTVFTITLRKGLKWSDGEDLTNGDVLFALQDVIQHKTLNPTPPTWLRNTDGSDPQVEEVDGSIVVTFANPFALFRKYLYMPFLGPQTIKPKHYLSAFHPDYTDKDEVAAKAKKGGFDTWDQAFIARDNAWLNPDRPTAAAYVLKTAATGQTGTAEYERNPYYHKTDPDGRQLPYIDRVQAQVLEPDTLNLRAAGGQLDLQGLSLSFSSTGLLQESAQSKGYRVLRWKPASSQLNIFPNLSHKDEAVREIFQQLDFRAALSHAINRDELNTQLLGSIGTYRQFCPGPGDDYYVEGAGERFLEFDVARANALLDGLGLDQRDGDGTRLRPDGEPLDFVVIFVEANATAQVSDVLEYVANAWQQIGVKLTLKAVDNTLYYQLLPANDYDFIQYSGHMVDWDMEPIWFTPTSTQFRAAPAYADWLLTGGESGLRPTPEFEQLWTLWNELVQAPTDEERISVGQQITRQWDEQVYVLGLIDIPFRPIVVNSSLQNVRDDAEALLVFFHGFDGATHPEQLYYAS